MVDQMQSFLEGPTAILSEALQGQYETYIDRIEPGEKQAHVVIEGPDCNWVLTCRKIPQEVAREEIKETVEA